MEPSLFCYNLIMCINKEMRAKFCSGVPPLGFVLDSTNMLDQAAQRTKSLIWWNPLNTKIFLGESGENLNYVHTCIYFLKKGKANNFLNEVVNGFNYSMQVIWSCGLCEFVFWSGLFDLFPTFHQHQVVMWKSGRKYYCEKLEIESTFQKFANNVQTLKCIVWTFCFAFKDFILLFLREQTGRYMKHLLCVPFCTKFVELGWEEVELSLD